MAEQLTLGDLIYRLGYQPGDEEAFIRDTQRLFDRAEGEAEKGGRETGKKFTSGFKGVFGGAALGSFLGTVMAQAFSRAQQAVTSFVQQSVRDFASYQQGLVQLKLAGVENLAPVEAEIKKIAEASKVFSTVDISDAVGQLVKAGFTAEQALTLVGKSADLAASEVDAATGSFGNISQIAQQAGQVVRAFGLDFSDTGHVIDVVAKAAQDSSADISDLIDAVSRVAPNGKQAGLSIEQLAGSIAVLTNKGIPAEYAARGLRSMLQSLINPPAAVKKQFDDLGISLVDQQGNVRDFNTVLSRLYDVLQQGGKGAQILGDGLGNVAVTIASSLGQSSNDVNQFSDNLVNADGSAKKLADTVRDSTAAELAAMQARIKDARVELGQELVPVIETLYTDVFPKLVSGLEQLIGLWQGLEYVITGTTQAITDMNAQSNAQYSPENQKLLRRMQDLRQQKQLPASIVAGYERRVPGIESSYRLQARFPDYVKAHDQMKELDFQISDLMDQFRANIRRETQKTSQETANAKKPPPGPPTNPRPPSPPSGGGTSEAVNTSIASAKTVDEVFSLVAQHGKEAQTKAAALGNTLEATAQSAKDRVDLVNQAIDRLVQLGVSADDQRLQYLVKRLGELNGQLDEAQKKLEEQKNGLTVPTPDAQASVDQAKIVQANRAAADARQNADEAQRRITDSLKASTEAGIQASERAAAQEAAVQRQLADEAQRRTTDSLQASTEKAAADNAEAERQQKLKRENRQYTDQLLREADERIAKQQAEREAAQRAATDYQNSMEALHRLQSSFAAVQTPQQMLDEKQATVELTRVKQQLGMVTRNDVVKAYQDEIDWMTTMLQQLPEGSKEWLAFADALFNARDALKAFQEQGKVNVPKPGATATVTGYDAYKSTLQNTQQQLEGVALEFPKQLVKGIEDGDVAGALKTALGDASDFFVNQMIEGILGPIAKNLASSISSSMLGFGGAGGASLTGAGLALGIGGLAVGLLLSLIGGSGASSSSSAGGGSTPSSSAQSAPAIEYNVSATVNVDAAADFNDPAFYAKWRSETENLVISLLSRVKRTENS